MQAAARYTNVAIAFHWIIALGIVINVTLAWLWPHMLPDDAVRPAIDTHKSIGITILGLAFMRLLWRFSHRPPPMPTTYQKWETVAAHWTHVLLYVILFAQPLTGWMMDSAYKDAATHPMHYFGTFEFPRIAWIQQLHQPLKEQIHSGFGKAHEYISYVLYALLIAHIGGALKHQILDKEPEIERMLPG
jgi:cytochrome b561